MSAASAAFAAGAGAWQRQRPLLLPALALWGWQEGVLPVALALALILELPRLVNARLEISQADFDRLWSFTSVLFLAVIFYLALAREGLDAVGALTGAPPRADAPDGMHRISGSALTFLRWLPYVLFPFTAAVAWSRQTVLPLSTFSLYEQARAKRQPQVAPPEWATRTMHPGYLYLGLTLFSASTTTAHSEAFLPLLLAALLLALWPGRNRSWRAPAWGVLVVLLGTVAAFGNRSHQLTRAAWEAMEERLLLDSSSGDGSVANINQASRTTTLGQIGALKQSSAIILRITTSDGAAPGLLREASFNRFHSSSKDAASWDTARSDFQAASELRPPPPQAAVITIARAGGTVCPLALPGDLGGLQPPRIGMLEAGGLGALRISGGQPLVVYSASRGGGEEADTDKGYGQDDFGLNHITAKEKSALARIAGELKLDNRDPHGSCARLAHWFDTTFSYRTYQGPQPDGDELTPLLRFLTVNHAGHCEYFATATVLLLRAAGIPARYAVGWSVSERDGARFLARARDAHAWTLVWDGTRWTDFDTTPASWLAEESRPRSWLAGLSDLGDEAWYRFALWRQEGGRWQLAVFIAGMAVLGWIAWRQLRGSAWRRARSGLPAQQALTILGRDSELARLLPRIAERHGERLPHETVRAWLTRLRLLGESGPPGLGEALDLHLRLRFDPAGLVPAERQTLRALVARLEPALTAG
jgi:protein-glutamine gamma-glutamyltransferase